MFKNSMTSNTPILTNDTLNETSSNALQNTFITCHDKVSIKKKKKHDKVHEKNVTNKNLF